jgi:23S rRNA (cytosine1962-C5)-methyltransferase
MCDISPIATHFSNFDFSNLESRRVFHGRGGKYQGLESVTIDWLTGILFVRFFKEDLVLRDKIKELLSLDLEFSFVFHLKFKNDFEVYNIDSDLLKSYKAKHLGLDFILKIGSQQNYGLFLDMNKGKNWFIEHCAGKKILNLFSYTCAFSVIGKANGATEIVNIDNSSAVLSWGRENHRINGLDMSGVHFYKKDIMKSLGWIEKKGPFDIIIFDPPSSQKKGFGYKSHYEKIVRRMNRLMSDGGYVLSCLNSPFETSDFIKSFYENEDGFTYHKTLYSSEEYEEEDKENGLKIVIFKKVTNE